MLADAACELFLERGYEATAVTEITRRAGVSRSSFFNYFASKSEILWYEFDQRIATLEQVVADADASLADALRAFASGDAPGTLALAIADARTMGLEEELSAGRASRQLRLAEAIGARLRRDGADDLRAEVVAAGYAAALVGTVWRWALRGAGRHRLDALLGEAIAAADSVLSARGSASPPA